MSLRTNAVPDGLSRPAPSALAGAGHERLDDPARVTEAEVAALHGMGLKGIRVLKEALAERGLAFADG